MMRYKLGLKPPRVGAIKMFFSNYAKTLSSPPTEFGHEALISNWGMLGNDRYGDCFWAGSGHETMLWGAEAGAEPSFDVTCVLADYTQATGFDPSDPSSDQGTDMQQGASYRLKTGIRDGSGARHKVGAYVQIQAGNLREHLTAAWLYGAVGLGLTIGDNQQDQFSNSQPWDGSTGSNVGGHYVPMIAYRNGLIWCVSWGKLQAITAAFFAAQNDQSICYFSTDFLKSGVSLEGFNQAQLLDDQAQLTKG